MRKLIFSFLFFFLFLSHLVFAQVEFSEECKKFKKGKFLQEGKENIKIKRGAKYQVEIDGNSGIKSKFRIKWVNDCEYSLTLIESNDVETTNLFLNNPMYVKIKSIEGNKYTYVLEASYDVIVSDIRKKGVFKQEASLIKVK